MTRRAGIVRLPLTHREAFVIAQWLRRCARRERTLLESASEFAQSKRSLLKLARRLRYLSRWTRTHVELARADVQSMVTLTDALTAVKIGAPNPVYRFRDALPKRGRPHLTRRQVQTHLDYPRGHDSLIRRYWRREERDELFDHITADGKTLLTGSLFDEE